MRNTIPIGRFHLPFFIPLLFVATGCYTFQQIDHPVDAAGDEIEITTKANETHVLRGWRLDSCGALQGDAQIVDTAIENKAPRRWTGYDSRFQAKENRSSLLLSIPAENVSRIRVRKLDTGRTVAAGIGIAATTCGIILVVDIIRAYQKTAHSVSPTIGTLTFTPW